MISRMRILAVLAVLAAAFLPGRAAEALRPVLVTIDDLPMQGPAADAPERERVTRALLDLLAKHNIKAVGFVIWGNVRSPQDEALLELWLRAGHELGSHSYSHPNLTHSALADYVADLQRARDGLAAFLDQRGAKPPRFFRYPMLNEGDTQEKLEGVRNALASMSLRNLPVTIDTQDWSFAEPWVSARRAADRKALARLADEYHRALRLSVQYHERHSEALFKRVVPQVLLLHANEIGSAEWDSLFRWLEQMGHRFASADEVLADPVFASEPAFVYRQGVSLWDRIDHLREWEQAQQDVRALLVAQSAAWTKGDIDSFCSVYADDTLFASPTGLTRGRQAVVDRYKQRYPTKDDMGALTLEIEELRPVWGPDVSMLGDSVPSGIHGVSVAAQWTLVRPAKETLRGWTLLVLHRVGREWKIVQDASM